MRRLLLPILVTISSCGQRDHSTHESIRELSSAVVDGVRDETHHAVVELRRKGKYACSGALVTRDLVLTARHCITVIESSRSDCGDAEGKMAINRELRPVDDEVVVVNGVERAVTEALVIAEDEGLPTCGRDIGMLRLARPVEDVPPLAVRLDASPVIDETVTAIGFGARIVPPPLETGERWAKEGVRVIAVGAGPKTLEAEWASATGPCVGDSGAPALDAEGHVLGIVSHGPDSCEWGVYQRVDVHAAWVRAQVEASAARLGEEIAEWAREKPADGSGAGCSVHSIRRAPAADLTGLVSLVGISLCIARSRRARSTRIASHEP